MNLPVWMEHLAADFRYAFRMIRKTPGTTAIAVLSLAFGIGANTAIFSVVDAVLLKMLPVKSPGELYMVASNPARMSTSWNYPDYLAFRDHNRSFTGLAAYSAGMQPIGMQAEGEGSGATELAYGAVVSGNYFEVLGVGAAAGRVFNPEDDRVPGATPYTVLSYEYWQKRFAGDPRAIGRKLRLNGYPFVVVGVARRGFRGADVTLAPNLFVPIAMRSELIKVPMARWNNRNHWWMYQIGRMKPGATIAQAETELTALNRQQEENERRKAADQKWVNKAQQIKLMPAARGYSYVRNRLEKPLMVLMAVVGLVLLIACANVANLMLARGAARQRELAVRLAVGATRARLGMQLLTESVAVALLGGLAGLALSFLGVRALLQFMPQPGYAVVTIDASPDLRLLAFAFAISLLTGVLFGTAPAFQATRPDVAPALKDGTPGAGGGSRATLRKALVAVQVALSLLLVVGAGQFVRSLGNLRSLEPGFRAENTTLVFVDPGRNGYKGQRLRNFYESLRASSATFPGVRSASLANITPLAGWRSNRSFNVEGYQFKSGDKNIVDVNAVGPRYFETMGIPLLLGRDFRDEDSAAFTPDPPEKFTPGERRPELPGPRVAIITEGMAKHFFGGNPIGKRLCFDDKYDSERAYEVVGVVKEARYFGLRGAVEPMVYIPVWRTEGGSTLTLCLRGSGNAPELVEAVRRQVSALDPSVPVLNSRSMEQQIDNNILEDRLIATLSSFFGSLALLLAGVGLYGVISYGVTRRTREIGIRMALGAPRSSVLWLVVREAALMVVAGAVIGIPAAVAATRLVQSLLYGVSPQDPLTIAVGTIVLTGVATLAALVPARRATRVDPNVTLRYE